MRSSGVLMPVTSLPSPWGVGTMGAEARAFVDFLARSGMAVWQVLPIVPTSYGDSPYQSFSTYAGNPYLIDLDDLATEGLLRRDEYAQLAWGDDLGRVDYGALHRLRFGVLRHAVGRLERLMPIELDAFCAREAAWLDDYALFMALKDAHGGASWTTWEDDLRLRRAGALDRAREELAGEVDFWKGVQCLFFRQWARLREHAAAHGVQIMGDVPFYVALDSADVWSHPEQFQLDDDLRPREIAGVPPDGFSAIGQLWGNPLFAWDRMKADGYEWWCSRVAFQLRLYDILRIDHFRGFDSYFAIPASAVTAADGHWRKGPGIELFRVLEDKVGRCRIVAEDLGYLTDSVRQLLADSGYPGMRVLEFAFDTRDGTGAEYLPFAYPANSVAYVGTHDNDTALGWLETAPVADARLAREYLHLDAAEGEGWGMMRGIWASAADLAVVQMQDLLGLGSEARLNTPSTLGGANWCWRALPGFASEALAERVRHQLAIYHRLPNGAGASASRPVSKEK
ncbi:MAG TPA: 4-alpha-glucanotransferase [Candidatus Olsenella pullistercoris]|uniref:4-alpha-glucanotransferase n=1 Tax=Candidatus Olsenella pullistercoris TaxID=2838712 RepID=A0A9D2JD80_9ACTN|nr:4-alpha-glucanotransferase [Candidatus Olsenella pullistercoris]